MNSEKRLDKLCDKMYKVCKKYFKIPLNKYMSINERNYGPYLFSIYNNKQKLFIHTDLQIKQTRRYEIVKVLKDTGYRRGTKKWTQSTAIAFMTEVMDLYCNEHPLYTRRYTKEQMNVISKEISNRYNVPTNKLKSEVAFIITRFYNGSDTYNLLYYFTKGELLLWKYRDINKFQQDVENGKVSKEDIKLYKEMNNL